MSRLLTPTRPTTLLAALLSLFLIATACGSDDDTTEASSDADTADATADEEMSEDAMSDGEMDEMSMDEGHDHGDVLEVPESMAVPTIDIRVEPDPMSGVNLFVELSDFTIAPESASTDPVDGEGHLHVYVDGERIGRFYNTALHLDGLTDGEHEITVEVSANSHAACAVDGVPITATETISYTAGEHSHGDSELLEVTGDAPIVAMEVFEDPKSGWNLRFDTTGFTFAPEAASTEAVEGEGHLHLYVDGVKQGRIYGEWWHLPDLPEGEHEVIIELSANDHRTYAVDGEPIQATATVTGTGGDGAGDGHDHGESEEMADEEMADMADGMEADGGVLIEASVTADQVDTASDRYEVPLNSEVTIEVSADRNEHIHLHGYDVMADVTAEQPGTISFDATVPGTFEVELEDSGLFLFEVTVLP